MTSEITRYRVQIARERIEQQTGEIPSSDGGGGSGGHSDRTGSLAFRHCINPANPEVGHMADVARRDSDEIDRLERRIIDRSRLGLPTRADVAKLDVLLNRWAPLTPEMVEGLRTKPDDTGAGWCQSHWRVNSQEPPRTPGSKLCRWCADWTRTLNEKGYEVDMPPREFVDAVARGVPSRTAQRLLPPGVLDAT